MQLALNKYKERKQANKWRTPSHEEQKLIALTAKLRESRNKSNNKEKKRKRDLQDIKRKPGKYAWKLKPPGDGEPRTKVVNQKTYHFCPNHKENGMWVLHDPKDCNEAEDGETKLSKKLATARPKLTLAKALQAVDGHESESSNEHEE